jgi:hypothetical protein
MTLTGYGPPVARIPCSTGVAGEAHDARLWVLSPAASSRRAVARKKDHEPPRTARANQAMVLTSGETAPA